MKSGANSVALGPRHLSGTFVSAAPVGAQGPLEVAALGRRIPFGSEVRGEPWRAGSLPERGAGELLREVQKSALAGAPGLFGFVRVRPLPSPSRQKAKGF